MILKRIYISLCAGLLAISSVAAPIDDAKRLYREGKYPEAITGLRKILKSKPKDGTANYYLGAALIAMGEVDDAQEPLKKPKQGASRMRRDYSLFVLSMNIGSTMPTSISIPGRPR